MVQLGTVLTAISLHTSCHPIDVFPRLPVGGWTCSMLVSSPRPKHRTDVGVQELENIVWWSVSATVRP